MTINNLSVAPDRALLCSDTLRYTHEGEVLTWPDGRPQSTTKLLVVAHAHLAMAFSGASAIRNWLEPRMHAFDDIDSAIAGLPELLTQAGDALHLDDCEVMGQQARHTVVVAGWSEKAGAINAAAFSSRNGWRAETYAPTGGQRSYRFSPGVDTFGRRELPKCPASMADFTRWQIAQAREEGSRVPFGGRLIVAEVTRDAITLTTAGDLGLPPNCPTRAA